jgi:hypothetical protein
MKAATGLRDNQRDAWVWVIAAKKAIVFLKAIRPFIIRDAVREKIDCAIEFQDGKRMDVSHMKYEDRYAYAENQWVAYWYMCHLNRRGRRDSGVRRKPS